MTLYLLPQFTNTLRDIIRDLLSKNVICMQYYITLCDIMSYLRQYSHFNTAYSSEYFYATTLVTQGSRYKELHRRGGLLLADKMGWEQLGTPMVMHEEKVVFWGNGLMLQLLWPSNRMPDGVLKTRTSRILD